MSSGESAPSTTLGSTSSSSFTSSPSSVAISADCHRPFPKLFSSRSLTCRWLFGRTQRQILPAAGLAIPACLFPNNVPLTQTSTSTGCHSSSLAGSVTVPSFLSTYSSVGIPMVLLLSCRSWFRRHHP